MTEPTIAVDEDRARYGGVEFGQPLSARSHFLRRISRATFGTSCRLYLRIEIVNEHHLPTTGAYILAPTHRSNLDTPIIGASFKRWHRYMAKDSMFKSPFWSQFLTAMGGMPVRRGKFDREILNSSLRVLAAGEPLVVFPEGARQDGPRIKPIFEGALWVAARAGVPILPAGIGGSAAAMPIGKKMVYPKKVFVVIGKPMDPPRPAEGKKRVIRAQLEEAAAELRERLQVVFDEAQAMAGTPNGPWTEDEQGDERREPWRE